MAGSAMWRALRAGVGVVVLVGVWAGAAGAASDPGTQSQYLHDVGHSSMSAATAITTANAASLSVAWQWHPDAPPPGAPHNDVFTSPAVVNGVVYIAANSGDFYAIDLATGNVLWKRNLGWVPNLTCQSRGTSASQVVLSYPMSCVIYVYEPGGDGYLYALNAATGAIVRKSEIHV